MRALVQRVSRARVVVAQETVGTIGQGLLVLLGVEREDTEAQARRLAHRVARLRVFPNEAGRLDRSLIDSGGSALVVSQFTLVADTQSGHRPSFTPAAPAQLAEQLYERFCTLLAAEGVPVERGVFAASMAVELVNDGPVTFVLDAQAH